MTIYIVFIYIYIDFRFIYYKDIFTFHKITRRHQTSHDLLPFTDFGALKTWFQHQVINGAHAPSEATRTFGL